MWERVGRQFFRSLDGPPMQWGLRIAHSHVRMAPCGGVLAVWSRDDIVRPHHTDKSVLQLFDATGIELGHITLDFGSIVDVLVTSNEQVVIISASGLVRHYTDFGLNFVQLRLPFEPLGACLTTDGGYMLWSRTQMAFVSEANSYRLVSSPLEIDACAFIKPDRPQVLVVSEGTAYTFDTDLKSQIEVADGVGSRVCVSSSSKLVAFSLEAEVKVYKTDFSTCVMSAKVSDHRDLKFVGDEALALIIRDGEADIVGFVDDGANSATTFFEEDEVALLSEIDGLRVLTKHNHSLYSPVAAPTVETFKLGSLAPSAILYSCIDQMDSGSARSDQTVKLLSASQLVRAVDTCISAALLEIEPKLQKRLLRAAAFGKSIADGYDSSKYVDALPSLRIGNALRSLSKHPLFVTDQQLSSLGTQGILLRLQNRKLWAEAVSVAQIEKVPQEGIYIEWACDAILTNDRLSDEELLQLLDAKLSKLGAFSHAKLALRAIEQGRQQLASALLEREPVAADRVRLLLDMGMSQMALEQSGNSGDPYLVDYVLQILAEQLTVPQFMRVIGTNKIAIARQRILVGLRGEHHVHDFYYHMDMRTASLYMEYDEITKLPNIHSLHALEKKFSANKKLLPEARVCAEWADLLAIQTQLESDYQNTKFVGLSAAGTISSLLKLPQIQQAQKLRAKLGISERQFWWLRLRALIERREFDLVWELGQSKKSPIGYRPFYDMCYDAGNYDTAAKFVELIAEASLEDKVKMLVKLKHIEAARQLATKYKDNQLLAMLNGL